MLRKSAAYPLVWLSAALVAAAWAGEIVLAQQSRANIADVRIGLADHYKAGHWTPVWVEIDAAESLKNPRIEVTAPDSDGVQTTATAYVPAQPDSSARSTAVVYTRVGRVASPIRIVLKDGERVLDERTMTPPSTNAGGKVIALSPTAELLVALGDSASQLLALFSERSAAGGEAERRVVQLNNISSLPAKWFGYEAADLIVISGGDRALLRELAADRPRFAALVRWVELGGRLVVLCGGDDAEELLADGGPLTALAPGKLAEVVRLPETAPLERFAKSDEPIAGQFARTAIMVPRLTEVDGVIEEYVGRQPGDLPLIVRTARGLGEISFVAIDLTRPPLADWPGRKLFLEALLEPYLATGGAAAPETLVTRGYDDLSGALRQRLGRSFAEVARITFPMVALLAVAYLVVLGPLDYFLIQTWLRRPWAAWVTFPLIVLSFGIAALALADWRSGDQRPRVNRLELVDVDTISGRARGTFWATLYSPRAEQFDLALEVEPPGEDDAKDRDALLSWWGLPGVGIGGMQGRGANIGTVRSAYEYSPNLDALSGLPVLTSATKSLAARWTARIGPLLDAALADEEGLPAGHIENRSGRPLRNVRLLYNGWGYRLGKLDAGERITIGEPMSPRSAKTIVTQDSLGVTARGISDRPIFVPEQASAEEILSLMMFYERAGGFAFARLPNQYQDYCDLSRLLELGRAIVVADVPAGGSRLIDHDTKTEIGDDRDSTTLVYRFVLPVKKDDNAR